MSESTGVAFDVLTKDNYNTWRIQAEASLVVSDLWDYVEDDKELISKDAGSRELWIKQDKIAKSKLILHISSTLIPLIENCTTSREVWLKLANVYGNNKNSDTHDEDGTENSNSDDEDAIVNDIENFIIDFFDIINDLSEKKIKEDKKSLSTILTDNLFSRSNMNRMKKFPDKQIIVTTMSDFIDVISKLSKIEIKAQKNELCDKLINILLEKFDIGLHENDNDETNSNSHREFPAETRSKLIPFDACDIAKNQSEISNLESEVFSEDESLCSELLQSNDERTPCESYAPEELENPVDPLANLYTPPPTPSPKRTYECGICREEGHDQRTCPLNKPDASASQDTTTTRTTPERSYECGVRREEGLLRVNSDSQTSVKMSESTGVAFDVLTKDNYNTWRIQAEASLVVSDLWDYVEDDKELISKDAGSRELWIKQDKIAKSKLILHISSTLIPLIENCTTSREVWLKLANVYGNNKNSDTHDEDGTENSNSDDEDAIVNDIENFIIDFFDIINDLSEKKIKEDKKSLSTILTDNLFSRSNMNRMKKFPDKQIIVTTMSDFIDVISKLSKIEIKAQKNELCDKLINILLEKFDIGLHENDNDETNSNSHREFPAETRSKLIPFDACDIAKNQSEISNLESEVFSEDESLCSELLQSNDERTPCESYAPEELENPVDPLANLYTPPPTPSPKRTYECGICREEGHDQRTCPLNKPDASASQDTTTTRTTPERSYECGVRREEGLLRVNSDSQTAVKMSESTEVAFDVLTKDNYNTWRIQAEASLVVSDLWDYVEDDKELISKDAGSRELWMKQDKIAKSKLILHISSTLIPLIENCTTSREVWLKLANVYGNNKNSDTDNEDATENPDTHDEDGTENSNSNDEDAIVNDIENFVNDFFEIINDLSEKKIKEDKKSLSTILTDNLFSRSNMNKIKKFPDKQIIVTTISDFIDVISKLSKIEMKGQKNELSDKLIDILLEKFDIGLHENDNDETKSNSHREFPAETRSKLIPFDASDIAKIRSEISNIESEVFSEDESLCSEWLQSNDERTPYESYAPEELENPVDPLANLYTPPPTPSPERTYECGICREEGHDQRTCPLNKSDASESQDTTTTRTTPKRSYKCGVCREEGHNRTTCPLNISAAASVSKHTADETPGTPKRSYKCGICREEGHNRTTCPLNKSAAASVSKHTADETPGTPKRSYKCGICREEGHNRTTCPLNKSAAASVSRHTADETPGTPKRSYKCGICREEGHNRTTCPLNKSAAASVSRHTADETPGTPKRSYKCGICREEGHNRTACPLNKSAAVSVSKHTTANPETPKRSYKCGICHEEGHNRTSCPLNKPAASASKNIYASTISETPKRSYKCGICREEGHNRTSCPLNKPAASASKNIYASTISETPKRSYKCGICREEGHNRTSCPLNKPAASASKNIYASTISETPKRSYKCGICREEGHNRTSCPLNKPAASASKNIYASTISETPKRSYKCGICREEGHNRSTCPLNKPAAASTPKYAYAITTYETPRRSYRCGNCGGEGHNSRTCGRREASSSSYSTPSYYTSYSSPASSSSGGGRKYTCGNCGGSGHNRRTCTR